MYHGYFEGYVKDDDGRCVHFEVECEKVRREDCVLIHKALAGAPGISECVASITERHEESEEVEEVFCDTCGCKLVFKTAVGPMTSSAYIGTSTCRDCQIEYCRSTSCTKCKVAEYPYCRFLSLKGLTILEEEEY